MSSPLRVRYDSEAFVRHTRSGITRYFTELVGELRADPSLGVVPSTPYRFVANTHLAHRDRWRHVALPLPGGRRAPVLDRLNHRQVARAGPADIVHHTLYHPEALAQWDAPLRVATVYDFTFERLPEVFPEQAPWVADKRTVLEACDALLCISETTRRDLVELWPELDKLVEVTPLGVAGDFFAPRRRWVRGLPEQYLLHVGARHAHKNVDLLLRAFAALQADRPELRLVLCGASLPGETERLHQLGIADRTLRVRVGDRALPWLYRQARAFVFPSRYEGFGLPVVEALATGCPTVTADIPALREVGADAIDLVDPDDVGDLVETLHRVLSMTDEQRDARAAQGHRRALDFTWRRTAQTTARAYARLAELNR